LNTECNLFYKTPRPQLLQKRRAIVGVKEIEDTPVRAGLVELGDMGTAEFRRIQTHFYI